MLRLLERSCEYFAGIVIGLVVFVFMFLAGLVLAIPEIPRFLHLHRI